MIKNTDPGPQFYHFKNFNNKIQKDQLDRLAIVYIRQSTLQQIEKHNESTKLQYALKEKAQALGWVPNKIVVIDDDLGRSGSNAEGRPGFQRLVAEVGLDHVGLILGIEISRLARSCKDWYQLLEICAIFRTLICDNDGIYDPGLYNDRLLLGLKGTMSEAELHILKQRMIEGKKSKARRGELGMRVPMGYIQKSSKEIIKDPDEQAQSVIQLVFNLFDRYVTVNAVLRYLARNKIQMPYRECTGIRKGDLTWHRPNRMTLSNLLHNPIYAGAYVYGRRPTDSRKKKPGRPSTGRTVVKPSEWEVCLKDKVPAYITWEQYERNLRQLKSNSSWGIGVPKHGPSLLSGIIICGRCGLRMMTQYSDSGNKHRYSCQRKLVDYGEDRCQSLLGSPLDDFIISQLFKALQPNALKLSLKISEDIEQERKELNAQWNKKLERIKYDVERAYRQYNSAEPENRLVVRTLEKNLEIVLLEEEKVKKEYDQFILEKPTVLSQEERELIYKLSSDIPAIWNSEVTKSEDKQSIIRLLIERVIVKVKGKTEKVSIEIHWVGGHKTYGEITRPVGKLEYLSYYQKLLNRAKSLRLENKNLELIADILDKEGWESPKKKKKFSVNMVGALLARKGIKSKKISFSLKLKRKKNELTFRELSMATNIPSPTLYRWMQKGLLIARRVKYSPKKDFLFIHADRKEIKRLLLLREQDKSWAHSCIKKVD